MNVAKVRNRSHKISAVEIVMRGDATQSWPVIYEYPLISKVRSLNLLPLRMFLQLNILCSGPGNSKLENNWGQKMFRLIIDENTCQSKIDTNN